VVYGMAIYQSFESENTAKMGIVAIPAIGERILGGHCMNICGWNDKEGMFDVRNSWGEGWGIKGYCKIPYEYILNRKFSSDFWVINLVEE
jgi:C1A family cysteine protease